MTERVLSNNPITKVVEFVFPYSKRVNLIFYSPQMQTLMLMILSSQGELSFINAANFSLGKWMEGASNPRRVRKLKRPNVRFGEIDRITTNKLKSMLYFLSNRKKKFYDCIACGADPPDDILHLYGADDAEIYATKELILRWGGTPK